MNRSLTHVVVIIAFVAACLFRLSAEAAETEDAVLKKVGKSLSKDASSDEMAVSAESLFEDSERMLYFGRRDSKGIGYSFVESMTTKLLEDRQWFSHYQEQEEWENCNPGEMADFAFYKGKIMRVRDIKREIAMKTVSGAAADTFEQTPLGSKIKKIEDKVSRYLTMEYSKSATRETASLYLPGELTPERMNEEKEYAVSMSALFYADPDTLNGDISFEVKAQYFGTKASTLLDLGKRQVSLDIGNTTLNESIGFMLGLSIAQRFTGETQTAIHISSEF